MSDLFCPATLILVRHGEAEYESDAWSDEGGSLTAVGREQAAALGERLRSRRIAQAYSSTLARAVQTAEIAAAALDVDVTARAGLREVSVGDHVGTPRGQDPFVPMYSAWLSGDLEARVAGGESGREVLTRLRLVVEEISDLHRGETVLVVAHAGIIRLGVHALARLAPGVRTGRLGPGGAVEIEVDADGMLCTSWDHVDRPSGD